MILKLHLVMCLSLSSALQAANQDSALTSLNDFLGKAFQAYNSLKGYRSGTLKPENEQLVRAIATDMNIKEFGVHAYAAALKATGPHTIGNDVFFDDEWFKEWAHYPYVQRFIIAHELGHVEKSHLVARVLSQFGTAAMSTVFLYKAGRALGLSPKVDTFFAKQTPWLSSAARSFLGKLFLFNASMRLVKPLASYVYRKQEFDADAFALEKLGPLYGNELIVQGAADYFKSAPGFEASARYINSTHPHSGDRIRAMGLSAKVSEEAGVQLIQLIKDRVKIRIDLICCPPPDDEQLVVLDYRFRKNWTHIMQVSRLCSVHPIEAQKVIENIGAGQQYRDLFHGTVHDLKVAEEAKGEDARHEVLSCLSVAQRVKDYETAIVKECELIGAVLREQG